MRRQILLLAAMPLFVSAAQSGQSVGQFHVGVTIGSAPSSPAAVTTSRYTWGAAAISVTNAGFESPVRLSAADDLYWFSAGKNGASYRVAVSAATGRVVAVEPA